LPFRFDFCWVVDPCIFDSHISLPLVLYIKNKILQSQGRRISPRYHPVCQFLTSQVSCNGLSRTGFPEPFRSTVSTGKRVQSWYSECTLPGFHLLFPNSLADDLLFLPYVSGPRGIRTLGLLNAIETRSQLRYGPKCNPWQPSLIPVDLGGFEPPASSVRLKRAPNCATGPLIG
jgi:hypothetical protein